VNSPIQFSDVLHLERERDGLYRSGPIPTELPLAFGGQVVAQALMAASRTVDAAYRVHSLHSYFLRPGSATGTEFSVENTRDGGTFCTRSVRASQNGQAIFAMMASFHCGDDGDSYQPPMPPVPRPDEIEAASDSDDLEEWSGVWDRIAVPRPSAAVEPSAEQQFWIRHRQPLPDDPVVHHCALAYLADMDLLDVPRLVNPGRELQSASLDHSMWFLRDFRADDWILHDMSSSSSSAGGGRALSKGRLFDRAGRLIAEVSQEGLHRYRRQ
jgi:acyl-CoA thioesterase-2